MYIVHFKGHFPDSFSCNNLLLKQNLYVNTNVFPLTLKAPFIAIVSFAAPIASAFRSFTERCECTPFERLQKFFHTQRVFCPSECYLQAEYLPNPDWFSYHPSQHAAHHSSSWGLPPLVITNEQQHKLALKESKSFFAFSYTPTGFHVLHQAGLIYLISGNSTPPPMIFLNYEEAI